MIEFFPSREIALVLFGWPIHWYGLMYMFGFLSAIPMFPHLQKFRSLNFSKEQFNNALMTVVIGVIVGGRLGFVLFYAPMYYLQHPLEIFMVWQGGMSSHGGFLVVILGLVYEARRNKVSFCALGDVVIIIVVFSLALGRLGNFINQELYGTVTTLPWGISIPGEEGLRHPTQIYAMLKDLFIFAVCYLHLRYARPVRQGSTAAIFLMLYAILRFLVEYLRVQEYPLTDLGVIVLTRGQLLSVPIFAFGVWAWFQSRKNVDMSIGG